MMVPELPYCLPGIGSGYNGRILLAFQVYPFLQLVQCHCAFQNSEGLLQNPGWNTAPQQKLHLLELRLQCEAPGITLDTKF